MRNFSFLRGREGEFWEPNLKGPNGRENGSTKGYKVLDINGHILMQMWHIRTILCKNQIQRLRREEKPMHQRSHKRKVADSAPGNEEFEFLTRESENFEGVQLNEKRASGREKEIILRVNERSMSYSDR